MNIVPPASWPEGKPASPNFGFLAAHHPHLVGFAAQAERYLFDDAGTALVKLRQYAEALARQACAYVGVRTGPQDDFAAMLGILRDRKVAPPDVLDLFHGIRRAGNAAVHEGTGSRSDALHHLRLARQLGIWFHRSFGGDPNFRPGPFVPPPDPAQASAELLQELERLRRQEIEHRLRAEQTAQEAESAKLTAAEEAELRRQAEARAQAAYAELEAALSLAEETEARSAAERAQFEQQLAAIQAAMAAQPAAAVQAVVAKAQKAATFLELDEAATRRIIDQQLRDAGWEADSQQLAFKQGTRPQKGRNLAIAEWPTAGGPADYVLFVGTTPIAAVEAKRAVKDVSGAIEQAKRYARDFKADADGSAPGGPWGDYRLPFCFAANGRPFLRQIRTKSGIWFLDARSKTNHPRPLEGWYSPAGLEALLALDLPAADRKLRDESPAFLPLREYQLAAIRAVECGLADGLREMLVAMATGTGKTRTCIGLAYRLIKAKRFRRILFLVDRTALGEQAADAFKYVKLENFRTFTEIYDVKELGDAAPDPDTRLHLATIQGLVRRLLDADDGAPLPTDAYDCIVVDECHRGYSLDKELSDNELLFRDEADYVSKYRRVLDRFDAVKIGLTATPALHTVEIFGKPVYAYSYRQAVVDGWLVDHEPPIRIVTRLAEDGIRWKKGEVIRTYVPASGEIDPVTAPDEVQFEIDEFNKKVVTENFNRVVCAELARWIDPSLPGKTIVYCAADGHADLVVDLLKQAFAAQYGSVEDDAVVKITAAADKPLQLIRKLKNERLPNVAVTVDLLTTGIDVPEVTNLVFLRRVRSRILYEQMLGRATRLCPELHGPHEDKECFRVYDAVDLYAALEPYSSMKPVVVRPNIGFAQLVQELSDAPTAEARREVYEQLVAKLRRKRRVLDGENAERFAALADAEPDDFLRQLRKWTPEETRDRLADRPRFVEFLDRAAGLEPHRILISEHADELRRIERGYGAATKPEDYLDSFREFVRAHLDDIPALLVVAQRPRDLTRKQLKELKLACDEAGFTEAGLQTAWRESTNQDVAATIIGYIRHVIAGEPLLPYRERVRQALRKILAARPWTAPQRKWLERIGKQLEVETIVDREALDHGQFRAEGGFLRLDKVFDGKLEEILHEIVDAVWQAA